MIFFILLILLIIILIIILSNHKNKIIIYSRVFIIIITNVSVSDKSEVVVEFLKQRLGFKNKQQTSKNK